MDEALPFVSPICRVVSAHGSLGNQWMLAGGKFGLAKISQASWLSFSLNTILQIVDSCLKSVIGDLLLLIKLRSNHNISLCFFYYYLFIFIALICLPVIAFCLGNLEFGIIFLTAYFPQIQLLI